MKIQTGTLKTKDNMATKVNMDRHVREGWTVGAFIRELAPQVEMIMSGQSWREPFRNKQENRNWRTGAGTTNPITRKGFLK